jgi:hypothetical protein
MSNLRDRKGNAKPGRLCYLRSYFGGGRDILVWLMSDAHRFPPPWSIDELVACFEDRSQHRQVAELPSTFCLISRRVLSE